jgi:hypothetical protein
VQKVAARLTRTARLSAAPGLSPRQTDLLRAAAQTANVKSSKLMKLPTSIARHAACALQTWLHVGIRPASDDVSASRRYKLG